ncbi:mechanosensitive ion channel family protein [Agriterribacter sp.]|uniref:mechanosensitive ion channel family protein n=1 Tax=Agriterribacter sp. TaxID=2821509 RepID=UPI002C4D3F48|nr:mechanosensitive ion channel family protein [Agriterribacter sp.]HRP57708.1 mechanosensitive ion channel family protein [Agriterribacter sp.]
MNDLLQKIYWGNTVTAYLIAAGGIIVAWLILKVIKGMVIHFLKKRSQRTDNIFDDLLIKGIEKFVVPCIYLLVNYGIITQLTLQPKLARILEVAIMVITTYFVIRFINFAIHGAILLRMERKKEAPERIKQLSGILMVVKGIIWAFGLIALIDNLGYDITTIIAGFGIGGIAIALAAQNILGDLFSYFVIFFDKPFEVGDFILANEYLGVVEKIGIKTTHVRSLDGQQLVMPNSELVKTVINNYKRLERRRVVFNLRVGYHTPVEKVRQIPSMINEIISSQENASFDRAHFQSFGEFSLDYEIVYYVNSPDYVLRMNTHQEICFAILDRFEKEKIKFALPTQTIFSARIPDNDFVAAHQQ